MKMKSILTLLVYLVISISSGFAQIKVACVGNSITFGAGIEGRDSLAYPPQMQKILGEDWLVRNFGVSGATMLKNGDKPYWETPQFQQAKDFLPDVVIIKLGTNDSKPQNWDEHRDEYVKDYKEMIRGFQKLGSHPQIFLGLPIPVVEDKWGISREVMEEEVRGMVLQIARDLDLETIDFYSVLKGKPGMIPDKIHPDASGSALMAKKAAKILKKKVKH